MRNTTRNIFQKKTRRHSGTFFTDPSTEFSFYPPAKTVSSLQLTALHDIHIVYAYYIIIII